MDPLSGADESRSSPGDATDDDDGPLNLFGGADEDEDEHKDESQQPAGSGLQEAASGPTDDETYSSTDRRQRAFETDPDDDQKVLSRLIDQTDNKLNDPATNRRRESINQLKAAVAATEADRRMGDTASKPAGASDEFRKDLRAAVRPRRPARPGRDTDSRTERPQVAPLKLVASQRVDIDKGDTPAKSGPAGPVRPRRVRLDEAGPAQAARDAISFEAFARDTGARGLAELLEAAAAYTAYVEGSDDFSRPQLMNKVRGMTEKDFSREEGLRSFGTLLREGRITKVRNGRFQVSEETRFHPRRRAG